MTTPRQKKPAADHSHRRYRAMNPASVGSFVLGVCSVVTVVHWLLFVVPVAGIVLGIASLCRIGNAPEELIGRGLARAGLGLSLLFWTLGSGWLIFDRYRVVPPGYQRIAYELLQPDPDVKGEMIPSSAFELQGKKVFVEGFMLPSRYPSRLKRFILCPRISNCDFCTPDPQATEMILVALQGDLVTDYTIHLVRLGGRFEVEPNPLDGLPYRMKVDYLR